MRCFSSEGNGEGVKRTKLEDRALPDYTRGEELFNTVSHCVGSVLGVVMTVLCAAAAEAKGDKCALVSSLIYGISIITLYVMSSVYHGLPVCRAKKVMQVIDHCTIYFLIAGTYTPILLCSVRSVSPALAWVLFGCVWGISAAAAVFTAIDLKKYAKLSMACYIGLGWCIVLAAKQMFQAVAVPGLILLLAGGIAYTVGAVLYGIGKKRRYMHCVFHVFVLIGSILHFFCVLFYVVGPAA